MGERWYIYPRVKKHFFLKRKQTFFLCFRQTKTATDLCGCRGPRSLGKARVPLPGALPGGQNRSPSSPATPGVSSLSGVLRWGVWRVFCFPNASKIIAGGAG